MGLFYTAPKPTTPAPSKQDLRHHGEHAANDEHSHYTNQHGSYHGEINKRELGGIEHKIHDQFSGTKRKAINELLHNEMDNSRRNSRGVIDEKEAESIAGDVDKIFSKGDGDKVRDILKDHLI